MTDIITRARKEWCETHVAKDGAPDGHAWQYMQPCPPEVVAALLDVLADTSAQITTCRCIGCEIRRQQRRDDLIAAAEAAIAKALEEV